MQQGHRKRVPIQNYHTHFIHCRLSYAPRENASYLFKPALAQDCAAKFIFLPIWDSVDLSKTQKGSLWLHVLGFTRLTLLLFSNPVRSLFAKGFIFNKLNHLNALNLNEGSERSSNKSNLDKRDFLVFGRAGAINHH